MIKSDITKDFLRSQDLLGELGFYKANVNGFHWFYHSGKGETLNIMLGLMDYQVYDNYSQKYLIKPHISLSYRWDEIDSRNIEHMVLITQNWESIRQSVISNNISDLGIKSLNRNIKLYALFNNIDYKPSDIGSISCMALKLNPKLYLKK